MATVEIVARNSHHMDHRAASRYLTRRFLRSLGMVPGTAAKRLNLPPATIEAALSGDLDAADTVVVTGFERTGREHAAFSRAVHESNEGFRRALMRAK